MCLIYRDITERRDIKLKEDGILKAARVILPAANLAICKMGELFSGDPSTTLKVCCMFLRFTFTTMQCEELMELTAQTDIL